VIYVAIFAVLICFLRIFRAIIEPEGEFANKFSTYISFTLLAFASSSIILVSNSVISYFCLQISVSNCCLSEIQFLNSYKKPGKYLFKTSSSIALYSKDSISILPSFCCYNIRFILIVRISLSFSTESCCINR